MKKKTTKGSAEMKLWVKDLRKAKYIKEMFNCPEKKEFLEPLFGFILPLALKVVKEVGPEGAFEAIFSEGFKGLCIQTLMSIKGREEAKEEVQKLAKDLHLKI